MIPRAAVPAWIGPGPSELLQCGALAAAARRPDRTVGPERRTDRPGANGAFAYPGRARRFLRVAAPAPRGGSGSAGGRGARRVGERGGSASAEGRGDSVGVRGDSFSSAGRRRAAVAGRDPGVPSDRTACRPDGRPGVSVSAVRLRRTRGCPGNMGLIYRVDEGERLVSRERLAMRGAYSY